MFSIFSIEMSLLNVVLLSLVVLSFFITFVALRKISHLEEKLDTVHLNISRDLKMVNQGAIGVGKRFASIEKSLKKVTNAAPEQVSQQAKTDVSEFAAMRQKIAAQTAEVKPQLKANRKHVERTTKAEKALSAWMNDHQTA